MLHVTRTISSKSVAICFIIDRCTFVGSAPAYVHLINGAALLGYQTLDNIDGRQARRTNTASPLGLLFDHLADATATALGCISTSASFGLSDAHALAPLLLVASVCIPLATSTWEQLCTGVFRLPVMNAPSDGLLAQALLHIWSAVSSPDLWLSSSVCAVYLIFVATCGVLSIASSVYSVHRHRHSKLSISWPPMVFVFLPVLVSLAIVLSCGMIDQVDISLLSASAGALIAAQVEEILFRHMISDNAAVRQFIRAPGISAPLIVGGGASVVAAVQRWQGTELSALERTVLASIFLSLSFALFAFNALATITSCAQTLGVPVLRI